MSNNPLSNESVFDKLKKSFKPNASKNEESGVGSIEVELVGMNRAIDICAEACAACWDKKIPDDFEGRSNYVSRRTFIGHTSILEHSNFVVYIKVPESFTDSLMEFLTWTNYLNRKVWKNSDNEWVVLFGGSYRGYADIFFNTNDLTNPVLKAVVSCLYTYAPSSVFADICKYGFMDKEKFMDVEPDENFKIMTKYYGEPEADTDLFKIVAMDDIKILYTNLHNIDKEFAEHLNTSDLLEFVTVSVMFKDMSRIITQQLTRHRNAITQESQRYVNYSNANFNCPTKFNTKYDPDHKYRIRFGNFGTMDMTLEEIGNAICGIYPCLSDPLVTGSEFVLKKEDARAFLPENVQCHKIYITFTYKKLFKFLELREYSAAQIEIRKYATALGEWFRSRSEFNTKEITDEYTKPKLMIEDSFKIDIIEDEHEEVEEITDEDYIRAAGLDEEDHNDEQ